MNLRKRIRKGVQKISPSLYRLVSRPRQAIRWFLIWRKAGLSVFDEMRARQTMNTLLKRVKTLPNTAGVNDAAVHYVGTEAKEGVAQLAILVYNGCRPHHKVLEIGCGALNAGYPIMQYLNIGNYYGIEPNKWLIDHSRTITEVNEVVNARQARFDYNATFDGASFTEKFDFVISHSILSHAAYWQAPQFFQNVRKVLKAKGRAFVSLHFTTGNAYGPWKYTGTELDFTEWVYPGVSYFRPETIDRLAKQFGFSWRIDLVAPMLITNTHRAATHSWIVLERL